MNIVVRSNNSSFNRGYLGVARGHSTRLSARIATAGPFGLATDPRDNGNSINISSRNGETNCQESESTTNKFFIRPDYFVGRSIRIRNLKLLDYDRRTKGKTHNKSMNCNYGSPSLSSALREVFLTDI